VSFVDVLLVLALVLVHHGPPRGYGLSDEQALQLRSCTSYANGSEAYKCSPPVDSNGADIVS
jgi:hypothetical protein